MKGPFKDTKLLIVVPNAGQFHTDMALSLALMVHHLTMNLVPFHLQSFAGSRLESMRQKAVDLALEHKATHLLFIDSDQVFPGELAVRWIKSGLPVVAANVATKSIPSFPTARVFDPEKPEGVPLYPVEGEAPTYQKVWRVGTGIMMLQRDTLLKLPRPCFLPRWEPALNDSVGEDWVLCEHLQALNIPIHVDAPISNAVGHVGYMQYGLHHALNSRDAHVAEQTADSASSSESGGAEGERRLVIVPGSD